MVNEDKMRPGQCFGVIALRFFHCSDSVSLDDWNDIWCIETTCAIYPQQLSSGTEN